MFVGFDEEEIGLVGSSYFADFISDEGYNVHSVHNFDMVGWDSDDDRKVHLGRPSSGLFELYEDVVAGNGLDIELRETSYGSSDHVCFLNEGFVTTLVAEEWSSDSSPYIHSSRDDYDTLDFVYLESNVVLINAIILELTKVN
jgi:Zn-dependent M28 family amino/carboxypeptidase